MSNPNTVDRAPANLVEKERLRVSEMRLSLSQIETQVEKLAPFIK